MALLDFLTPKKKRMSPKRTKAQIDLQKQIDEQTQGMAPEDSALVAAEIMRRQRFSPTKLTMAPKKKAPK